MTNEAEALEVARAYHRAWSTRDLDAVGDHLSEELTIEVPINAYPGKPEFLEAVHRTAEMARSVKVLSELGGRGEAMLLYDLELPKVGVLRVAEHFTVRGGRITRIRHIHDTAALRAAGFERRREG